MDSAVSHRLPGTSGEGAAGPELTCVISSRLRGADRQALVELFERSTPESRYRRFHHALSVFPERYLDDIVAGRQIALVARDTCHPDSFGKVFGLASAAPAGAGEAEFAVWVDDAWQGRGVGSLLVRGVLRRLAEAGTAVAVGYVQPDNVAVRRLVSKIAPDASWQREDGLMTVRIPLSGAGAWPG